jgi:hypothetical protein
VSFPIGSTGAFGQYYTNVNECSWNKVSFYCANEVKCASGQYVIGGGCDVGGLYKEGPTLAGAMPFFSGGSGYFLHVLPSSSFTVFQPRDDAIIMPPPTAT